MAKAADCKSAMSRFESGRRLTAWRNSFRSCMVYGVNVVANGGISTLNPCILFPLGGSGLSTRRGGFSFSGHSVVSENLNPNPRRKNSREKITTSERRTGADYECCQPSHCGRQDSREGCFRIFGATFHKEYLNFLYPIEVIEDYFTAQCRLPKMKPCKAFLSDGVVIRAFLPTSTDVEIIYIVKSPSPSSVAASQDLSDPSP